MSGTAERRRPHGYDGEVEKAIQHLDPGASTRRPVWLWMLLVALLLRVALLPFPNFQNLMDPANRTSWEQGNVAEALLAGQGFGSPFASTQPSAIMPPVYPLIVAVFFHLFGVHTAHSILAIGVFDCLINSLACIPLFLLARNSFGGRVALWAGWTWAFFPYGIYFAAGWAWSTHLLLVFLYWLLYLAQELERTPSLGIWAGFGLLAGCAGLTEPSILLVVAFLLAFAAWRIADAGKHWLQPALVASLVLAVVLAPWLVRDEIVFHRFIPMRDSMGLELWMGNNGDSLRWTSDQLHPLHDAAELALYNAGELVYMDHKNQQARSYIGQHRMWFAWMSARRAVYLWTGFWSFDKTYLAMEPMDPENVPFASGLTVLALFGLRQAWRRRRVEALRYCGVLLLLPTVYYFTHPEPYHMRPLDPLLVMLGCYAVHLWRGGSGEINSSVAVYSRSEAA